MDIGWPHVIGGSLGSSALTFATMQLVPALRERLLRRNGNGNGLSKLPCDAVAILRPILERQTSILEILNEVIRQDREILGKMSDILIRLEDRVSRRQ